jgi:superfamily II DNA or RNA helicase
MNQIRESKPIRIHGHLHFSFAYQKRSFSHEVLNRIQQLRHYSLLFEKENKKPPCSVYLYIYTETNQTEPFMTKVSNSPAMSVFPAGIQFKYQWRKYQQRVLDELNTHLNDNHLHIIAPPGSGKTVLGLEVALRLNRPTLVLAPTVSIKNQWIYRFCELFLQTENKPDWISSDIKHPLFLTVSTYQALHAACTNSIFDEEAEAETEEGGECVIKENTTKKVDATEILKALKHKKIGTIVVDEAHHLKNEWWKSLIAVKEGLNSTIVGLTATPPYDVSYAEWQRYVDLNGPVDAEITVPELVIENDLCPHQDFIYLSEPTNPEKQHIIEQRKKSEKLFEDLKNDVTLVHNLMNHPVYLNPDENLEWIYDHLECYSSILIFLNAAGIKIPETHLEIIGDKKFRIPGLNYDWLEILLTFYLFTETEIMPLPDEHREKLKHKLSRNGILEKKHVCFNHNQKITKSLGNSLSKLKSIDSIIDIEHNTLGDDLRMVILTDYIRKEFLTNEPENNLDLNKIGVLPIFEQIRRTNDRNLKIGILTGSLVIIPEQALPALKNMAGHFVSKEISTSTLPCDTGYLIVNTPEQLKHSIVHLITQIFEKGEIHVLVGTKSLLGEGWDAPTINSLVLASFVGSFVLSNQMRGRAIRTDRNNQHKTGNIWHLICVDNSVNDGGEDIQILKRRFRGFVGISNNTPGIENGISRLCLPRSFSEQEIRDFNNQMIEYAGSRDLLKRKWTEALVNGVALTEEIKIPFQNHREYKKVTSVYFNKTIGNSIAFLSSGLLAFGENVLDNFLRSLKNFRTPEDFYRWLMITGIVGTIIFGRQSVHVFRLYVKYRDISKDFGKIGEALLETMIKTGVVKTDRTKVQVVSTIDEHGAIYCHLEGASTFEKSVFIKSIQEIIGTINNPRYMIIRKSTFMNVFLQKDYHTVPEIIGQNKKTAEYFARQWKTLVGACELIYTRTIEGRKILLTSRMNSLASEFSDKSERINKWR